MPKHFPFPWFDSVLKSGDCNAKHIANVFSSSSGLFHDLQKPSTTPAFSWITPNNCSDAHDAVCHGNNLSGGFSSPTTAKAPINFTGGLYAGDLFLSHIIPEIEKSAAFKDGGLIDVTFDEAFPPFTYTGNSFANSTKVPPTAATSVANDTAAETLFGKQVHFEPTGPNTPLKKINGKEIYPAPATTPSSTGPVTASRRRSRPSPRTRACSAGATPCRVRAPTRVPRPRPGSP